MTKCKRRRQERYKHGRSDIKNVEGNEYSGAVEKNTKSDDDKPLFVLHMAVIR